MPEREIRSAGSIRYAAYGSNLHPLRLAERLPSARFIGPGFLARRSLHFHKRSLDGSGKCSISSGGSGVHVAVYEISLDDKHRLGGIEGVGLGYSDEIVDVPGFSDCATYIGQPAHIETGLPPYDWYRELVMLGCRYHGFPDEYIRDVCVVDAVSDPDKERNALNWRLVERLRSI